MNMQHSYRQSALHDHLRVLAAHLPRLTRFGVVGVSGVLVNMAVLWLGVEWFHLNHLVAAAISSEVSIVTNFALNDRWTFRGAGDDPWSTRAFRYNTVALGGMAISLAVLAFLTTSLHMHYMVANLVAIGMSTCSNYVLNSRFTWAAVSVESR